jgi:hypothetical protein
LAFVRWASFLIGLGMACAVSTANAQTGAATPPTTDCTIKRTLADAEPGKDGFHRAILMQGLDKITGRTTEFEAPLGVEVCFFKLRITARQCIARPPEETPETTAYLDVSENTLAGEKVKLFSGWMFASSPALNALEHAVYDVWVVSCRTDEPVPEAIPPREAEAETPPPADDTPIPDEAPPPDAAPPGTPVTPPPETPPAGRSE